MLAGMSRAIATHCAITAVSDMDTPDAVIWLCTLKALFILGTANMT